MNDLPNIDAECFRPVDKDTLLKMRNNALQIAKPNATKNIVNEILDIAQVYLDYFQTWLHKAKLGRQNHTNLKFLVFLDSICKHLI